MRNLKRALSLALASVMLLGMMVVGTSAASYPDVDENDNVEAIEVLNAVQVMIGDRGNFRPDAAVNRHEMAVIMAKLVLGNETADNYVGTHPFTDVFPWADKYVAACYENGLVSGTSATTYGGNQPLTAVQAAAMMLRALGYEDLSKGATDWRAPVTAAANRIRLFDGVASNPSERLNRNQVAQLALNTLKSPVVDTKQGLNITGSNGDYTFTVNGDREYIARSSREAYARAINSTESQGTSASSIGGYTIELGEHLYNGDLKLYDDRTDVFGRPARRWEYKGVEVGTYAKTELLRAEYTSEVTGRELYDLLGASVVKDFDVNITIDGIDDSSANATAASVFNKTAINRNNRSGVGATGDGVLTQVYVDPNKGANGTVDIAIINTYLARAAKDYDSKKETLDLNVYGLDKKSNNDLVKTITAAEDVEGLTVSAEDFVIADVKEKDSFLVTVADGAIQTMQSVAPMSAVEITSFQARTDTGMGSGNLTTGGKKYEFSSAAEYDDECLKVYTDGSTVNLKETTYDIYLDNYDNVIGVVEVDKPTNYVFITGVDSGNNNLASTTLKANAIFLDGTMKEIQIDRNNSKSFVNAVAAKTSETPARMPTGTGHQNNSTFNQWCTYSVSSSDVYSLTMVAVDGGSGAAGQTHTTSGLAEINNKHLSVATTGGSYLVYGNNKSVYLSASVDEILTIAGRTDCIINDVDSVTTGIDNVDMVPLYGTAARNAADDTDASAITISEGAYTLYDKNGWIIAMVVIGDDNGKNSELVYVHNASVAQEYYMGSDGYKWERTVIIDGVEATLTEVNDTRISMLQQMYANNWYRVKTNNKGEVTAVDGSWNTVNDIDNDGKNAGGTTVRNGTSIFDKIGDWGFKADGTTRTAYVFDYRYDGDGIVDNLRRAAVDTILYHEAFTSRGPRVDGQTLYVTDGNDSGIRFAEDVKVVLDQMNDNKRETAYYNGETGLKNAIRDLHPDHVDANGDPIDYDYEISAVIEGPYATSVVIRDNVNDGNGGGALTPGGVAGVKVAIAGADASASVLNIGYFGVAKPDLQGVWSAVESFLLTEANGGLGFSRIERQSNAAGYQWDVWDEYGTKRAAPYTLSTSAGILEGVRVRYTNETGTAEAAGYEILDAAGNTTGSATKAVWAMADANGDGKNDVVYAKNFYSAAGYYTAAKTAGTNTWTWSDKVATADTTFGTTFADEHVSINGHDYDVFLSTYTAKVKLDNNDYYGVAGTTTVTGAAGSGVVLATALKAGDNIKVDKSGTITFITRTAAAAATIADGDIYNSGYVAVTKDTTNIASVAATGVATPTADADQFYVPAGSTVTVTLKAAADGKGWQLKDADKAYGSVFTATNPGNLVMPATAIGTKDITLGEVKTVGVTLANADATNVKIEVTYGGKIVTATEAGAFKVPVNGKIGVKVTIIGASGLAGSGTDIKVTIAGTGAGTPAWTTYNGSLAGAAAGVLTLTDGVTSPVGTVFEGELTVLAGTTAIDVKYENS